MNKIDQHTHSIYILFTLFRSSSDASIGSKNKTEDIIFFLKDHLPSSRCAPFGSVVLDGIFVGGCAD